MRVRNAFIYSTVSIAALAAATPSYAQTSAPVDTTPEKTAEGEQLPGAGADGSRRQRR